MAFCFLLMTAMISATDIVLSVADFSVETGQTGFQHIAKGISRIVAGELRKTKGLFLLEREQIVKILEEQELSLSGLTDESRQIEIGKLLSAEYLIIGELIDMKSAFLVSVRMVSVTTGQVVWQADISEKLEILMPASVNHGWGTGPVEPDTMVLPTQADLAAGRDPALDAALEIVSAGHVLP
jgi:TolB-like protein